MFNLFPWHTYIYAKACIKTLLKFRRKLEVAILYIINKKIYLQKKFNTLELFLRINNCGKIEFDVISIWFSNVISQLTKWVWRRRIFYFVKEYLLFRYHLGSSAKRVGPSFEQTWIFSPKDILCQFAQWFWRRISFNIVNVFSIFRHDLTLENGKASILNNLEFPAPKNVFPKCVWNWLNGFGEISSMYSRVFVVANISPLRKGGTLHSIKPVFPSPKDALCQIWLKLG